MGWWFIILLFY